MMCSVHDRAFSAYQSGKYEFEPSLYQDVSKVQEQKRIYNSESSQSLVLKKALLANFIPEAVRYMTEDERCYWQAIISDLFEEQLYLYNYHLVANRKQFLAKEACYLKTLSHYLGALSSPAEYGLTSDSSELTCKLSCLKDDIKSVADDISRYPSVTLRKWLAELNWYRLYWIWAGGGGGVLSGITEAFSPKASQRLDTPANFLSIFSFSLYFIRLTLHLLLFLKHLIPGPWMSREERALLSPLKRASIEWEKRKYVITNDIIWGGINLGTAFWLISGASDHAKRLGAFGGVFNVILMTADILVSMWQLHDEEKKYRQQKEQIEMELARVRSQNRECPQAIDTDNKHKERYLTEQLETLNFEWKYRKKSLKVTRNIAIAFLPVMLLIVAPLFPPLMPFLALSHMALNGLMIAGGLGAMGLTMVQSWHDYSNEVAKTLERLEKLDIKERELQREFDELKAQESLSVTDKNRLRMLLLEEKSLRQEREYHHHMISFQKKSVVFSLSVQTVFPMIVMSTLFVSPPVSAAILLITAIALLSAKLYLKKQKPIEVDNESICLSEDEIVSPEQQVLPKSRKRDQSNKSFFHFWHHKQAIATPPRRELSELLLSTC